MKSGRKEMASSPLREENGPPFETWPKISAILSSVPRPSQSAYWSSHSPSDRKVSDQKLQVCRGERAGRSAGTQPETCALFWAAGRCATWPRKVLSDAFGCRRASEPFLWLSCFWGRWTGEETRRSPASRKLALFGSWSSVLCAAGDGCATEWCDYEEAAYRSDRYVADYAVFAQMYCFDEEWIGLGQKPLLRGSGWDGKVFRRNWKILSIKSTSVRSRSMM